MPSDFCHCVDKKVGGTGENSRMKVQNVSADSTAAYVHALNRIGEAIEAGGTRRYFSDET